MNRIFAALLVVTLNLSPVAYSQQAADKPAFTAPTTISGYRDASAELAAEKTFIAVPDAALAKEHLRTLTKAPHVAGSPEDKATAEYVLQKYKEAGLDAYIQQYKIWMNLPGEIHVDIVAPAGVTMHGPSREHVDGDDPYQNDPRVLTAYNAFSPSGDVTAEAVYVNYGRPEDFKKLKDMGVDLRGKIAVVRYGMNFRGVKPFVATEYGCVGVIIYSDPWDDGYFKGDKYPKGPWRPDTAVQRG
ncbi:MAG TPA: PA domain-containing protein, partial [Candidatus Angelobacter sp.]|nr:PA domain-containing protein [Candidatus Angelobacter sp.]